ncbi:MAG: hypothetical protein ACQETL_03745 [Bacteroidota bacterium]
MTYNILTPRKSLNKVFLKVNPNHTEIDQMVYELDGLTEEEIKVVEGGVG